MACAEAGFYKPEVLVELSSAGFREDDGRMAGRPVRNAAAELGFSLEAHRSTKITKEMAEAADLIIYMDGGNLERLVKVVNIRNKKTLNLGFYCRPQRNRIEDLAFISPNSQAAKFQEVVLYIRDACDRVVRDVIAHEVRKRQPSSEPECRSCEFVDLGRRCMKCFKLKERT